MADVRKLVLLTRPQAASEQVSRMLSRDIDAEILIAPLASIEPLEKNVDTSSYAGLIFTSASAVPYVAPNPGQPAYCVGPSTGEAAEQAGFKAISGVGNAKDLVARLISERVEGPLLHVRGFHAAGTVAAQLRAAGCPTDEVIVYRQTDLHRRDSLLRRISEYDLVVAPVFSPRSARRVAEEIGALPNVIGVAISPAASDALENVLAQTLIASAPTREAMLAAIRQALEFDSLSGS